MLSTSQLTDLFDRLCIPNAGRKLVLKARIEAPVRKVKSYGGNVITFLASSKMGREIGTESAHIEFPAAVIKEHDPEVLEYYAQPCELKLELVDVQTGEISKITHFPDYLVLQNDEIRLEEWKSSAKLAGLAEKYPNRYATDGENRWYSPQIEKQLAEFGIRYRIYSELDIPRRRVSNILHLAEYFQPAAEPCPESTLEQLHAALQQHGALYFAELCSEEYGFKADHLFKAVADNLVVADLDRELLSDPRHCRLYRDETLREFCAAAARTVPMPGKDKFVLNISSGTSFHYDGQDLTIDLVTDNKVICCPRTGNAISLPLDWLTEAFERGEITSAQIEEAPVLDLARYPTKLLNVGLKRQELLQNEVAGSKVSQRTMRRWRTRQSKAMLNGANEVVALVPNTASRGNREPRLNEHQVRLIQQVIDTWWRTSEASNYKACHNQLLLLCANEGVTAPSYPTLIKSIKAQETTRDLRIRHGKRMAYQLGEFIDILYYDTPVHGSRPFQYVHIDHTQLDIELISSRTDKPLGRPWLSLAVDAYTRRILGFYLTFDSPSYRSVMMLMRDIVKRYQRLPEFIVADNGRDFDSEAFMSFLRTLSVNLRFRPAGQPRHGSVLERLFGSLHTEYVHNLAGNTKATKVVRMVTGSHLPVNLAEWNLEPLYYGIQHWATEYYDQEKHPTLDCSPREAFARGLKVSGLRAHKYIAFNRDFLIATCPPVDREGVRLVDAQRGVKVDHMLYWNPDFRRPNVAGHRFPVRYDPFDASSVYVYVKDKWLQATCRALHGLGQLTEFERKALTEEYKRRSGTPGENERSIQRLREFMQVFTPEGALAVEFERQQQNKALYSQLQLAAISPVASISKTRLEEDTYMSAQAAETRSFSPAVSTTQDEASASDTYPEFDTF